MSSAAQSFADRLNELETNGDIDEFVSAVFTTDVVLVRPETGQQLSGPDGARTFWAEYLGQFREVHSTFTRIADGPVGILEWTSRGRLPDGTEIDYAGVSLLDFDADGAVSRFSTYYDTSAFGPGPR